MAKHVKTITLSKNGREYELEIDAEDFGNLIIETVTLIDGPKPEGDIDPTIFTDDLTHEEWLVIEQKLEDAE